MITWALIKIGIFSAGFIVLLGLVAKSMCPGRPEPVRDLEGEQKQAMDRVTDITGR